NLDFASIDNAVDSWGKKYGDVVRGASSMDDFLQRLKDAHYNTVNKGWKNVIMKVYNGMSRRVDKIEGGDQGGDE
ncbi:MAG: hypothetical protein HQL37_16210, partial [Alphaproteobacteria bacterium]|nr:hypothetical protein [Alphaproteobacteria bacterium]